MKHRSLLKTLVAGSLFMAGLLLPASAKADRLLDDDFSTFDNGLLYGQNNWIKHQANQINDPISVEDFAMSYPGYNSSVTKAVKIVTGTTSPQEKLKKQFREKTDSTDPLYYAAIINLSEVPTASKATYFLSFITANANADAGLIDSKGGDEHGRVFALEGSTEGTFKLAFSKYSATKQGESQDLPLNTDVLVVVKWTWVEGTTNDQYDFWVNPVKSDVAPSSDFSSTTGSDPVIGTGKKPLQGIEIRQGLSGSKATPTGYIGALKVTSDWAELWSDGGDTPEIHPAISVSSSIVEFGMAYQGMAPLTKTINVKGSNLTGDITVSGLTSVTASATTIAKADAESENGFDLVLTLPADNPAAVEENLVLETEGAAARTVKVSGTVIEAVSKSLLSDLNKLSADDGNLYRYTGEAIVTFVDSSQGLVYIQDETGGLRISYIEGSLTAGDKITDLYCVYGDVYGGYGVEAMLPGIATVVSQGNLVEPLEVALEDLNANRAEYMCRLVKISDVTFLNAGQTFSGASTKFTSNGAEGEVRAFPGTDLVGTEIPSAAAAIIGISNATNRTSVSMRSLADLVAAPASLEITPEQLISDEWQEINGEYPHTKFTVKAVNLESPVTIWMSGADRTQFALDTEEIPAGSSTTVVTLTYKPTKKGKHTCNVFFETAPTELNQGFSVTARAWDPANPPTLTLDASAVEPFYAMVGEQQTQTMSYTATGLLDYGNAKVAGTSEGAFIISSTMLMKDGTYNLGITFSPKAEGTFTETIEFSGEKMETQTITVTGTAGSTPEQLQGDQLAYDTANPRALVIEDFENCGNHNKPLSIDGWKNVAMEGTRAWWAYTFSDDNNTAAKVTAYDSKVETGEGTPCRMLLLSPALSYTEAAEKLLAFSVMGDLMSEGQTDSFEVLYIDPTESAEDPYIEVIGGLNIPATADYNKEWIPYTIDLTGQEIADVFFIGFRFTSTRGADNSAVYYVDNFSWGRNDIPFIRPVATEHAFEAEQNVEFTSPEISVEGLNLTDVINIEVTGPNASKFSVEPATIPAEGGSFTVKFLSEEVGIHEAYVRLTSTGAPDSYIHVLANNGVSAIESVEAEGPAADVYTVSGVLVARNITVAEARRTLAPGIYIHGQTKLVIK